MAKIKEILTGTCINRVIERYNHIITKNGTKHAPESYEKWLIDIESSFAVNMTSNIIVQYVNDKLYAVNDGELHLFYDRYRDDTYDYETIDFVEETLDYTYVHTSQKLRELLSPEESQEALSREEINWVPVLKRLDVDLNSEEAFSELLRVLATTMKYKKDYAFWIGM